MLPCDRGPVAQPFIFGKAPQEVRLRPSKVAPKLGSDTERMERPRHIVLLSGKLADIEALEQDPLCELVVVLHSGQLTRGLEGRGPLEGWYVDGLRQIREQPLDPLAPVASDQPES